MAQHSVLKRQKNEHNSFYSRGGNLKKNFSCFLKAFDVRNSNFWSVCGLEQFRGGMGGGKIQNFAKNTSWVSTLGNIDALNSNLPLVFQSDHQKRSLGL